jgi:hypothetical protein
MRAVRVEEGNGFPGAGVSECCEASCGCLQLNLGSLLNDYISQLPLQPSKATPLRTTVGKENSWLQSFSPLKRVTPPPPPPPLTGRWLNFQQVRLHPQPTVHQLACSHPRTDTLVFLLSISLICLCIWWGKGCLCGPMLWHPFPMRDQPHEGVV